VEVGAEPWCLEVGAEPWRVEVGMEPWCRGDSCAQFWFQVKIRYTSGEILGEGRIHGVVEVRLLSYCHLNSFQQSTRKSTGVVLSVLENKRIERS
jgi:hypothetical protein